VPARSEQISSHLSRLEGDLARRQRAVASLRDLLAPASPGAPAVVEVRSVPAVPAAAITEVVDAEDSVPWLQGALGVPWLQGALGELQATLTAQNLPAGGIFAGDVFTRHLGRATIFVPCAGLIRPVGRVIPLVVPVVELAVITHSGPPADADRAYGTLAAYVARHALAVDGPIREYYLVGQRDTADTSRWRTEIGWPVFRIGASAGTCT
jgi:effector-binding domain-containing protein